MKAIFLTKDPEFRAQVTDVDEKSMPEGDVTVRVEHSTINDKDALALTNTTPNVRQWPMLAGIDFAGPLRPLAHDGRGVGERERVLVVDGRVLDLHQDITLGQRFLVHVRELRAELGILGEEDGLHRHFSRTRGLSADACLREK